MADLLHRCSGTTYCHFVKRFQRACFTLLAHNDVLPEQYKPLAYGMSYSPTKTKCRTMRRTKLLHQNYLNVHFTQRQSYHDFPFASTSSSVTKSSVVEQRLSNLKKDIFATLDPHVMLPVQNESTTEQQAELIEIARYYFNAGGKLIRPRVALIMAGACYLQQPSHSSLGNIINDDQYKIAAIAEMVHTASLVHDDVIDEALQRRGQPSCNAKWGNRKAVLVGDYLLAKVTRLLCSIGNADVILLLARVIEDLVRGEFMQLGVDQSDANARFNNYMARIYKKTASLFAHSCQANALLAGCSEAMQMVAYEYGRNIGMAFQLIDDVLDFVSTADALGKPASAADLKQGLATGPVLLAAREFPELEELLSRRFSQPGDVERTIQLVNDSAGVDETKQLALHHCRQAIDAARQLPGDQLFVDNLIRIADEQVERNC